MFHVISVHICFGWPDKNYNKQQKKAPSPFVKDHQCHDYLLALAASNLALIESRFRGRHDHLHSVLSSKSLANLQYI